jgi:hypothetical protein
VSSDPARILDRLRQAPGLTPAAALETSPLRIPTRILALDGLLDGGVPCGGVTELVGPPSSGKTTLAYAVAATVTIAGELAACIDLPNAFDPEHAVAAGVHLPHLLWVRPPDPRAALRATEHLVSGGGFRLIVLDLDDGRPPSRTMAPATWLRLGRAAARSGTAVVAVGGSHPAAAFAVLRLEVGRRRASFSGSSGPCPLFDGLEVQIRLRKHRHASLTAVDAQVFATTAA